MKTTYIKLLYKGFPLFIEEEDDKDYSKIIRQLDDETNDGFDVDEPLIEELHYFRSWFFIKKKSGKYMIIIGMGEKFECDTLEEMELFITETQKDW